MKLFSGSVVPDFAWEQHAAYAAGISVSQLKFMAAFLLSVLVGAVWRYIPGTKGKPKLYHTTPYLKPQS
jgi:hypothetical protein